MAESIYDLVYFYADLFYPRTKLKKEDYRQIHNGLVDLLEKGWTDKELIKGFKKYHKKHPNLPTMYPFKAVATESIKERNLLKPNRIYYHNQLRLIAPPPKREIDYNTGEIVNVDSVPYFLEMRSSYTIDDLIQYFMKQTGVKGDRSRLIGSFKWLIERYEIELILYMIDVNVNIAKDMDYRMPKTPLEVTEYMDQAMEMRDLKVTEAVMSGGDKIVKRKRNRRSRDGN